MINLHPLKNVCPILLSLCLIGFTDINLSQIETAIIQKQYKEALSLTEHYIKEGPSGNEYYKVLYYKGLCHLSLGDYADARSVFQKLIDQRPGSDLFDKAKIGIIDSHILSEDYGKAIELANDLLRRKPHSEFKSLIYLKMARSHMKLTHWEEAQRWLNKIMEEYPNSIEYHLARQLLSEKQYFAVQVGAFLEKTKAGALIEKLKDQGEYAYMIETVDKAGERFYRVRIGRFSQLDDAKRLRARLSQLGYPTLIYP